MFPRAERRVGKFDVAITSDLLGLILVIQADKGPISELLCLLIELSNLILYIIHNRLRDREPV
jgi:hypothetical protein